MNISIIEKKCLEKNIKLTEQRRIIARVVSDAKDHPNVEELYKRISSYDDKISIATVYRTLKTFEEHGIVSKHDFKEAKARYEIADGDHHDHMINIRTGEVIEFFNEEIEKLQEKIAEQYGFKLIDHRLELYVIPNKA